MKHINTTNRVIQLTEYIIHQLNWGLIVRVHLPHELFANVRVERATITRIITKILRNKHNLYPPPLDQLIYGTE